MKILLTLFLVGSLHAQVPKTANFSASGGGIGNGGDGSIAEEALVLNMIKSNFLKLEKFLRTEKRARTYFSEIDHNEFSKRILDIVQNNKIKLIRNGDKENNNAEMTEIHDQYGIARTAVNYSETNTIKYDFEKVFSLQDKPKVLFVLNAHEILSLMGIEINDPNKPDQYLGYNVSSRFQRFVIKAAGYDLVFSEKVSSKCEIDISNARNYINDEVLKLLYDKGYTAVTTDAQYKLSAKTEIAGNGMQVGTKFDISLRQLKGIYYYPIVEVSKTVNPLVQKVYQDRFVLQKREDKAIKKGLRKFVKEASASLKECE